MNEALLFAVIVAIVLDIIEVAFGRSVGAIIVDCLKTLLEIGSIIIDFIKSLFLD